MVLTLLSTEPGIQKLVAANQGLKVFILRGTYTMEICSHTALRNDNRWTTGLLDWQPRTGKSKRGRQRRWRDDSRVYAGATWTRTARNSNEWRRHEEG